LSFRTADYILRKFVHSPLEDSEPGFYRYPVVNCGFGGSRLSDCLRYVSRVVLRLKPAAVVLYAGDNDLAQGALPDQAFASFRIFTCTTRLFGADANCLYLRQTVPGSDPLHRQHPSLQPDGAGVPAEPAGAKYIDIYTAMLGQDQKPNPAFSFRTKFTLAAWLPAVASGRVDILVK